MLEYIRSILFRRSRAIQAQTASISLQIDSVAAHIDAVLYQVNALTSRLNAVAEKTEEISNRVKTGLSADSLGIVKGTNNLILNIDFLRDKLGEFSTVNQESREITNKLLANAAWLQDHLGEKLKTDDFVNQLFIQTSNKIEDLHTKSFSLEEISKFQPHLRRNLLPNDSAALQKILMFLWSSAPQPTTYRELSESGFRVFSQNDEDGIILRIFSAINTTNKCVIEIGSNCSDSDIGIPENISTNLIVNHGWHGSVFEIDADECDKIRYFFSRNFATKHFHMTDGITESYFSPNIVSGAVTTDNVNDLLQNVVPVSEPDLFIIDIDGGDYDIMDRLHVMRPRVVVVEFEKRFREHFSVVQRLRENFSKEFPQSGAASLEAWHKLMSRRDYILCAIGTCGYNAFFVRSDVAKSGGLQAMSTKVAFDTHPLLSQAPQALWRTPGETWEEV